MKPAPPVESFDVCFIEPVNVHLLAERATKYAILFIALTFGGFFPVRDLAVAALASPAIRFGGDGAGLVLLLLLSLSEHIAFGWAYATARCERHRADYLLPLACAQERVQRSGFW